MTTHVLPQPAERQSTRPDGIRLGVIFVLAVWFLLVVLLGAGGVFVGRPGTPPVGIAIGVGAPLLIFFGWLRLSDSFRSFILSLDLQWTAGMQAWRFAGLGFIFLYAYKVLPVVFALPAGLGDMAIGFAAPWMVLALARRPGFAGSAAFIRWNVLGIIDLVVAICIGALTAMLLKPAPGVISTVPMATLPLLVIPAFLVPFFMMLHVAALMQSRQASRNLALDGS